MFRAFPGESEIDRWTFTPGEGFKRVSNYQIKFVPVKALTYQHMYVQHNRTKSVRTRIRIIAASSISYVYFCSACQRRDGLFQP